MSSPPPPKQLEEFQTLVEEVHSKSAEAKAVIEALNKKVGGAEFDTKDGLSFLELKNHVMLDYMANLTYVMLRKCSGKSINGEKAIERICEDRTVLEKMKPTEKKLRYQIDKSLKVAESGQISTNDPLNFRPNLSALKNEGSDDDDNDDSEEDDSGNEATSSNTTKVGKYVPPKNVPAFDAGDVETQERNEEERNKKRSLSKSIMEDLRRQHSDLPDEEHSNVHDTMRAQQIAKMKERIRYEEDNFMRLPLTKKDKHKRRQMTTIGTLGDELTYFGENSFNSDAKKGQKKRKFGASGGKSKGAARKKFKKH